MKFAAVKINELFHVKLLFPVMMLHNAFVTTATKGFNKLKTGKFLHQKPRHLCVKLCDGFKEFSQNLDLSKKYVSLQC